MNQQNTENELNQHLKRMVSRLQQKKEIIEVLEAECVLLKSEIEMLESTIERITQ